MYTRESQPRNFPHPKTELVQLRRDAINAGVAIDGTRRRRQQPEKTREYAYVITNLPSPAHLQKQGSDESGTYIAQ